MARVIILKHTALIFVPSVDGRSIHHRNKKCGRKHAKDFGSEGKKSVRLTESGIER